jgi:hypothetical protein
MMRVPLSKIQKVCSGMGTNKYKKRKGKKNMLLAPGINDLDGLQRYICYIYARIMYIRCIYARIPYILHIYARIPYTDIAYACAYAMPIRQS